MKWRVFLRQTHLIKTCITAKKENFSIKYLFIKCDQIRRKLRIWSHSLKKCLMENFIFSCIVWERKETKQVKSPKHKFVYTKKDKERN